MTNLDDHEASTLGHESYHAHACDFGLNTEVDAAITTMATTTRALGNDRPI